MSPYLIATRISLFYKKGEHKLQHLTEGNEQNWLLYAKFVEFLPNKRKRKNDMCSFLHRSHPNNGQDVELNDVKQTLNGKQPLVLIFSKSLNFVES